MEFHFPYMDIQLLSYQVHLILELLLLQLLNFLFSYVFMLKKIYDNKYTNPISSVIYLGFFNKIL